jgi:hypothetical protein
VVVEVALEDQLGKPVVVQICADRVVRGLVGDLGLGVESPLAVTVIDEAPAPPESLKEATKRSTCPSPFRSSATRPWLNGLAASTTCSTQSWSARRADRRFHARQADARDLRG